MALWTRLWRLRPFPSTHVHDVWYCFEMRWIHTRWISTEIVYLISRRDGPNGKFVENTVDITDLFRIAHKTISITIARSSPNPNPLRPTATRHPLPAAAAFLRPRRRPGGGHRDRARTQPHVSRPAVFAGGLLCSVGKSHLAPRRTVDSHETRIHR